MNCVICHYQPWEERMQTAHEHGTLVLLQNLEPSYTSAEVEVILILEHGFFNFCCASLCCHIIEHCKLGAVFLQVSGWLPLFCSLFPGFYNFGTAVHCRACFLSCSKLWLPLCIVVFLGVYSSQFII